MDALSQEEFSKLFRYLRQHCSGFPPDILVVYKKLEGRHSQLENPAQVSEVCISSLTIIDMLPS
jgi:hypothetical protein